MAERERELYIYIYISFDDLIKLYASNIYIYIYLCNIQVKPALIIEEASMPLTSPEYV
jgi:hypothetical protein